MFNTRVGPCNTMIYLLTFLAIGQAQQAWERMSDGFSRIFTECVYNALHDSLRPSMA